MSIQCFDRPQIYMQSNTGRKQIFLFERKNALTTNRSHHDVEGLPPEPGPFGERAGVKLRGQTSLEFRFQDVAAKPVLQEPSLVDLHLL